MNLRDYQSSCLQQALDAWRHDPLKNYIIDACVASGKSVMLAALAEGLIKANKGFRILMLVPNKELVQQNYDKLVSFLGEDLVGICSASASSWDTDHQIIVGTVGTVIGKIDDMDNFDMVNVDECHYINRDNKGQYRQLLDIIHTRNPKVMVFGWTGTPYRGNGIWLTSGKEALFHSIASSITLCDMLKAGWLCPLKAVTNHSIHISSEHMKKTGDDFRLKDISAAFDDEVTQACVEAIVPAVEGRRSIMIYCSTIEHAERTADMLREHSQEPVELVHSEMNKQQRDSAMQRFTTFRSRFMVNVAVLTTGFDHPATDAIVLMRNTSSPVLYVQIAGRGMRRYDSEVGNTLPHHGDKEDCLWMDFTDTTLRMGPVDQVTGREAPEKKKKRKPSKKTCPACQRDDLAPACRLCPSCGHAFTFTSNLFDSVAGSAVLSDDVDEVIKWSFQKHVSRQGRDCAKLTFTGNQNRKLGTFYVSDSTAFTRRKMQRLWETIGGTGTVKNHKEFLDNSTQLTCPVAVKIQRVGQFPELKAVYFAQEVAA